MTACAEQLKDEPIVDFEMRRTGRLASILNGYRSKNKFGGTSYDFLYLTNECNYACDMCYMDSRPGLKNTRLNPNLSLGLLSELGGIDKVVLSGGEVSFLPSFDNQLRAASRVAGFVTVYTNGTGFLDRAELKSAGTDQEKIFDSVRNSMERKLASLPPNIEMTFPVTEYHLVYDNKHRGHRYAEAIVRAGASLAREWSTRTDRPKIRFIAKNTPGKPESGNELINRYQIEGLGSTGAAYPGGIVARGRGVAINQAKTPSEDNTQIEGGIHVNHLGIFANEPSLLQRLHFGNIPEGQICPIDEMTTPDSVVQAVTDYISKHPQI